MKNIIPIVVVFFVIVFILGTCKSKDDGKSDVDYITSCQKLIKQSVNHPSTVDHKVLSTNVYHAPNGNVAVTAPFSAKNTFGVEMQNTARCIFPVDGKPEITIQ